MSRKCYLKKYFVFDSAHHLEKTKSKCNNTHGHQFRLFITIEGTINEDTGIILDFEKFSEIVKDKVINIVDHRNLNDIFKYEPTVENIIYWIFDTLSKDLNINEIELWETEGSCAILTWKQYSYHKSLI